MTTASLCLRYLSVDFVEVVFSLVEVGWGRESGVSAGRKY